MSFLSIWGALVNKEPKLKNDNAGVQITSKQFKTLLKQVYDRGVREGADSKPPSIFDQIFGGK